LGDGGATEDELAAVGGDDGVGQLGARTPARTSTTKRALKTRPRIGTSV